MIRSISENTKKQIFELLFTLPFFKIIKIEKKLQATNLNYEAQKKPVVLDRLFFMPCSSFVQLFHVFRDSEGQNCLQ